VMAADVYAKNGICNSFASSSDSSNGASSNGASSNGAGAPDPAELRKQTAKARTLADMLFFHSGLKHAVNGMADDVDHIASLADEMKTATTPEDAQAITAQIPAIANSLDLHVREAQRACGQKETGILTGN